MLLAGKREFRQWNPNKGALALVRESSESDGLCGGMDPWSRRITLSPKQLSRDKS